MESERQDKEIILNVGEKELNSSIYTESVEGG
jgi:hypothetical protein